MKMKMNASDNYRLFFLLNMKVTEEKKNRTVQIAITVIDTH